MDTIVESLYRAALTLPVEAREDLAERILRSLDGHPDLALSPEQEAEIERRVEDVRQGRATLIPAEEVFESILSRLRERKRP